MSDRNPADGWYTNEFARRIGLDRDPRTQRTEIGEPRSHREAGVGRVCEYPYNEADEKRWLERRRAKRAEAK